MKHPPYEIIARAPGKLILSGEHAVVYGAPALALAINRFTESSVNSHGSSKILFHCLSLNDAQTLTLSALKTFSKRMKNQYYTFLEGGCPIREVIRTPFELWHYTVIHLLETAGVFLAKGFKIRSSSHIPMGCGMGSSAALITSTLYALISFLKLTLDPSHFFSLSKEVENLQHGWSSGLDISLAMNGGCVKFEQGNIEKKSIPSVPMMIVQTGPPLTSTGECVDFVAPIFKTGSLMEDFKVVTEMLEEGLEKNHIARTQEAIKMNHRLLTRIGVVPSRVQDFIKTLEKNGGAAKICGAGAIKGDGAGVVLVIAERNLSFIAKDYGYPCELVQGVTQGMHLL